MKVLIVNTVCGSGSTGKIAVELYHNLEAAGHACCIAYGRGTAPDRLNVIKIGGQISVGVHGLFTRITDCHGFLSKKATERFIEEADRWKPDIVHLHNIHGYYLHIPTLFQYLKNADIPVIWTLHDCWPLTGHCAYFDRVGCDRWKMGCFGCPQKQEYPISLFMDNSAWNYREKKRWFTSLKHLTIVTPSTWMEEIVKESFLKQYPVRTIYNGIDLSSFYPIRSNFRNRNHIEDKCIILGVANVWEARKGLDLFVGLAKLLDARYCIVMVGVTEQQRKQLPDQILAISRTESVRELAEIYGAADIFFNASLEETMGLVTVEALACGTPVIAFDRTAIPETFDSSCGILIPAKEDGILEKVRDVIEDGAWKNFGKQECITFAKRFDKKARYNQYVCLVEELSGHDN